MTREELKEHCERQIQQFERVEKIMPVTPNDWKRYEEHKLILELLEQKPCKDDISRQAVLEMAYDMSEIDGEHFTEPWMVVDVEDIQKLPSVNPQEPILDKIRAEIEQEYNHLRATRSDEALELGECLGLKMSLKIINKYKAESEPQERNDKE